MNPGAPERLFATTFGYWQLKLAEKIDIFNEFENDISQAKGLPPSPPDSSFAGVAGRHHNLRQADFPSDKIHSVFYNDLILDTLHKLADDFVIVSAMESFYLSKSGIHRDFAGEIRTYKAIFYLDDVSTEDRGPLYVIPGSHNIFDRYSTAIASNVGWPAPEFPGDNYIQDQAFMNEHVPVKYFTGNADTIVFFNSSLLHGSHGNTRDASRLRRAICMTFTPVDRTDKDYMAKIDNFFSAYNINSRLSHSFEYCKHNNLSRWLEHFYSAPFATDFTASTDGTDANALAESNKRKRFARYLENLESHRAEIATDTFYNCYKSQLKDANDPATPNGI